MKKLFLTLLLLLIPSLAVYAQQSITLSTYYPSPFGSYDRLQLVPHDMVGDPITCDATTVGTLLVEEGSNALRYCDGTGSFDPPPGVWTQSDPDSDGTDQIYPTDQTLFVGIGTNTPTVALDVVGNVVASGKICSDDGGACIGGTDGGIKIKGGGGGALPVPLEGPGVKFLWHPTKGAFRAGECTASSSDCMDNATIGNYSTALGQDVRATEWYSTAIGFEAEALDWGAVALGYGPKASGLYAVALGGGDDGFGNTIFPTASGDFSFAMGVGATASGISTIALGQGITVSGNNSTGIALNDQAGTTVAQANTMAIMGGNVGIGTTTPSEALEVSGNILASGTICNGTGCTGDAGASLPSGAVIAFDLAVCPAGWTEYVAARNRTIIGSGSSYALGATGGAATHTLTVNEMPSHRHGATRSNATYSGGGADMPIADPGTGDTSNTTVNTAIMDTGGSQPHNNMQPYIALLYCRKN